MAYAVVLTAQAEQDLAELYDYLDEYEVPGRADELLDQFEAALAALSRLPDRGVHPKELAALGIKAYREIRLKPYRIIYRVEGKRVIVMLITDGRRDMQQLLERRLLNG